MLGTLGQVFGISPIFTAVLGVIASLVMILLGLNLAGIAKRSLTLPDGLFQSMRKIEHKTLTPLMIGIATFFLPCGFTQSMQVAALTS